MGSSRARAIASISFLMTMLAASADAAPIVVTFDSDPAFASVGNDFTSSDSSKIHFSDSSGADLFIANDATATGGSNALAVLFDDSSALVIELDFLAGTISMDVGNDVAAFAQAGDVAVLTTFLGGVQVGQVSLVLNLNTAMDQTILFDGAQFDSATLEYSLKSGGGLTEVVDNVTVTPIPEPGAVFAFGVGCLLVGSAVRRRPRRDARTRP